MELHHFAYTDDEMAVVLLDMGPQESAIYYKGMLPNMKSVNGWKCSVLNNNLPIERGLCLLEEDKPRQRIINPLMCDLWVDKRKKFLFYGIYTIILSMSNFVQNLMQDGLVTKNGDILRMTAPEAPYLHCGRLVLTGISSEQKNFKAV